MDYDVIQVKPLGHLRLAVWFRDGLSGEVEFRESHLYGVFEALKDPEFFQQVHCKQGFVEWPGELDLAPDAMHEAIKKHGRWILERTELGAGNRLLLAADKLLANTRGIQTRNDIEVADPAAPLEAWELFDGPANQARLCPHFSVEMETGTGKTYVYLRTIFELSRRYRFQKFIIVVPSVAIREGVLKNIEITAEHFRTLGVPFAVAVSADDV